MSLSVRSATAKDLGFVLSLAQNGARHGHFDKIVREKKGIFREYLNKVVSCGCDLRGYPAHLYVAFEDGERVATATVTTAIGTPDVGVELEMIAVRKDCQSRGYGSILLDTLISLYVPRGSVYLRCLPASRKIRQMLLRRHFNEVGAIGEATIFRRESLSASLRVA